MTPTIPKKLNMIWVGVDANRPDRFIETWRSNHTDWEFRLWGNADLETTAWACDRQVRLLAKAERWEAVADVMRYEILHRYGGVYADADSVSVRPLDDWLLKTPMFTVWESEQHAPGLIANGFIGAVPGHPALAEMIRRIGLLDDPLQARRWWFGRPKPIAPWKSTGPRLFTKVIRSQPRGQVTTLPSVMFLPQHFCDPQEREAEVIYARHFWATTKELAKLSAPERAHRPGA
ncbi:MAG: hypothetical protein K9G60_05420 [Pseudolabrys sp.]|nr:hypothetical protein [Pseudolabrys sp.]